MTKSLIVKTVFLGLTIGFILFTAAGFCASPFKLGVAVVRTGELTSYGISGLRGVQMAVRTINADGGILGRPVQLIVEDDSCLPTRALIVASKLTINKVDAVIGHICSGATFAALETYKNAGIIVISPSATNPDLTQSGDYPNFFRTIASDDTQALVQVELVVNRLRRQRIAVIHDDSIYGKGLAQYAKEILEKTNKRKLILYEGVSTGASNYNQFIQKIVREKADAVIYGGYHPGAVKIIRQIKTHHLDTIFVSGDGIKDESFITGAGKAAEGVYATAPKDTSRIPMAIKATKAYRAEFGEEPGAYYLNAYAAVLALANAVESAKEINSEKIAAALRHNTVETPIGRIGFDNHGDATGTGFSVYQVQNGRFVELE